MNDTLILLAFLGLSHLAAGVVAGRSFRRGVRRGWSFYVARDFLWGVGFGVIALFLSAVVFAGTGMPYLVLVGFLVFVSAILGAALTPDWIVETLAPILAGAFLMVIGVVLFQTLAGDSLLYALLALAGFAGLGGYVFVTSMHRALNG